MDVSEMRRLRDEAVLEMRNQLDQVESAGLPQRVLMTLMVPLFMGAALQMTCRMLWALIVEWFKSPFIFMAIWTDLMGIMWWFLRSSVKRMSRK